MKRQIIIILGIFIFIFLDCFEIESIHLPPFGAKPDSTFSVPISVSIESPAEGITPIFAMLLPQSWTVIDSISVTGSVNTTLVYSDLQSEAMENQEPAPEDYYWCASASPDTISVEG
ncbi:hypothetical protein EH223_13050 [candidate division KSB1 bacterium]|nr:hypothetical protein [candidate division KSB1 bacterium]RQW02208.1 MAG: hypothetical protein EH223_13050 [candidate division KSB1 bacterium]